jgi:hypothetical protein
LKEHKKTWLHTVKHPSCYIFAPQIKTNRSFYGIPH